MQGSLGSIDVVDMCRHTKVVESITQNVGGTCVAPDKGSFLINIYYSPTDISFDYLSLMRSFSYL